jgi:Holliday junction resolvasome RuvABC endonuclease subunit
LAHCGWCIVDVTDGGPTIRAAGVIETVKGDDALVAQDHHRRATELATALEGVFEAWRPDVVFAESFSPPRDARNASMLAWSWGVLSGLAARRGIPVHSKSPVRLKGALTGDQGASKGDMIAAVRERYPEVVFPDRRDWWEHVADSVAAAHAFVGARS